MKDHLVDMGMNDNEVADVMEMFDEADTDDSGAVDIDELEASISEDNALAQTFQSAKEIMDWLDSNDSGEIEADELLGHLQEMGLDQADIDEAMNAFGEADTDDSGSVSIAELEAIMAAGEEE